MLYTPTAAQIHTVSARRASPSVECASSHVCSEATEDQRGGNAVLVVLLQALGKEGDLLALPAAPLGLRVLSISARLARCRLAILSSRVEFA